MFEITNKYLNTYLNIIIFNNIMKWILFKMNFQKSKKFIF